MNRHYLLSSKLSHLLIHSLISNSSISSYISLQDWFSTSIRGVSKNISVSNFILCIKESWHDLLSIAHSALLRFSLSLKINRQWTSRICWPELGNRFLTQPDNITCCKRKFILDTTNSVCHVVVMLKIIIRAFIYFLNDFTCFESSLCACTIEYASEICCWPK